MEQLKREVCELIIERLGLDDVEVESIDYSSPLFSSFDEDGVGLGLDSIDSLELVVALREKYGVTITDQDMGIFQSIDTIANFVSEKAMAS